MAADAVLGVDTATQQHAAGVHPHANVEAVVPMLAVYLCAKLPAPRRVARGRAHRAFGIVLACFVGPEHREHVVAGVLQHLPAMALNDSRESRKGAIHDVAGLLGVEALAQRGRSDDVEEQDRDLLQCLGGNVRGRVRECGQFGAQRNECRVDERIAEQRALGFEPGDGAFELFSLPRHAVRISTLADRGERSDALI